MSQLWSLTALALELDRDRQALARALKDLPPDEERKSGRGVDRRWKLARVVNHLTAAAETFDSQRERLAAAQAEKVETDNAERRRHIADVRKVERAWQDLIGNARAKLLNMGPKLGPQLVNIGDPNVISSAIRAESYAALTELAAYDPTRGGPGRGDSEGEPDVGAAAEPDGQRVGRPRKAAQQRKQRRARDVED